jgi:hypothetical protein
MAIQPSTETRICPTYHTVDSYLTTIQFLENWPIGRPRTPPLRLGTSDPFSMNSKICTDYGQSAAPLHHRGGITLKQIVTDLGRSWGWPTETAAFLQFALYGHLSSCSSKRMTGRLSTHAVEVGVTLAAKTIGRVRCSFGPADQMFVETGCQGACNVQEHRELEPSGSVLARCGQRYGPTANWGGTRFAVERPSNDMAC